MRTLLIVSLTAIFGMGVFSEPVMADSPRGHHKHHHWKNHKHGHHYHNPKSHFGFYFFQPSPFVHTRIISTAPVTHYYDQPVVIQPQNIVLGTQVASHYGQFCREYQSSVWVGRVRQNSFGTACLQPDGSWRIVN
jgi:hypothetical protein